jgi:hypothetical protein
MSDQPLSSVRQPTRGGETGAVPPASADTRGRIGIAALERWSAFGATWQLAGIESGRATIDLYRCTGELEERRWSEDPAVLDFLHRAETSG